MDDDETQKSVLSKSNSVGILVFILQSGGSSKATFIRDFLGTSYYAMQNSAARLIEGGLLTIEKFHGKSGYTLYTLTDRGRAAAQHLDAAERTISGELSVEESEELAKKLGSDDWSKNQKGGGGRRS